MADVPMIDPDADKPQSYKDDKALLTRVRKRTKLMIEDILRDVAASDPTWRVGLGYRL